MDKKSLVSWSEKISFILLCVLMCDCCIFGSGRLIEIGPLGFRMLLFGLTIVAAVPMMLDRFKEIIKNKYFIAVIIFAIWVLVSLVIGIINSNRVDMMISDIKGYMYFALLPVGLCVLDEREKIHKMMRAMMYSSVFFALCIILITIIYICDKDIFNFLNDFLVEKQMVIFASVSSKLPRLFFRSIMYLLCGCAFATYFQMKENGEKLSVKYILIVGLCFFGIFMTYTRSVYLGTGIAALVVVVSLFLREDIKRRKSLIKHVIGSVAALFVVVGIFSIATNTNYARFALERTLVGIVDFEEMEFDDEDEVLGEVDVDKEAEDYYIQMTMESDELRQVTLNELYANISNSPIIGNGLGKALVSRDTGYHEYFYLDVLSKSGIIGLILYMMPLMIMFIDCYQRRKKNNDLEWTLLAVLLGFMVFSWFNPYMNTSLGILYYCCVMSVFSRDRLK